MRQFEVRRLRKPKPALVVVLQHDLTHEFDTLLVAPLSDIPYKELVQYVRFPVQIDGKSFILQTDRMAAVPKAELGELVGNVENHRDEIARALDLLFFGI